MTATDWGLVAQVAVGATFLVLLLADAFIPDDRKSSLGAISAAGLLVALGADLTAANSGLNAPGVNHLFFHDTIAIDGFAIFFQVVFIALGLMVLALAPGYLRRRGILKGEFYVLLVAALAGMTLMVSATNLITIFLGIELLSIALYVLSAFLRQAEPSQEAGLKYLLIGGFASGFLLYGMALLYGGTGSTSVGRIATVLPTLSGDPLLFSMLGIALLLVGVAFKSSAAPFHTWTPDVYQGAPTPVVAFMSVGTKVAAVAVFLRIFVIDFAATYSRWVLLLGAVAGLSMLVGAIGALRQEDLKRMLAYSSVAQAGYLLLAVVAGPSGMTAGLFYLAAYGVMTFGAFGVVSLVAGRDSDNARLDSFRGLGWRRPVLGGLLALFMLSLASVPPTVGFMGKLFVLEATIRAGYAPLAIIAIISSAISLYYYLRVVLVIYTAAEGDEVAPATDPWATAAIVLAGILTLVLGIFPGILYGLAQRSSLL